MKQSLASIITVLVITLCATACSSVGPRKYILFGDPQPEKVEMFEDYWKDYPFKPDDPDLPLRRGKGGVIRFFKKNSYTRAIMVDGDLTVNVYYSQKEGVTLTQPDAQMVITSKELNEQHRKFDKENGYSYHVYLDLGEYDQPEEEITILSVFKDAKTGQATLSKEIRTTVMGTSPPVKKKEEKSPESEAEMIARRTLGLSEDDDISPISALQARYSARKRQQEEIDLNSKTRVKDNIDLSSSQFENVDKQSNVQNVSYMEEMEKKRAAKIASILEQNKEKQERYRSNLEARTEEYRREQSAKDNSASPIRDARGGMAAREFNMSESLADFQQAQNQSYSQLANQFSELAEKEYAKGPDNTIRSEPSPMLGRPVVEMKSDVNKESKATSSSPNQAPDGFEKPRAGNAAPLNQKRAPSELDALDDFNVDSNAPPTEIYVKKYGAY